VGSVRIHLQTSDWFVVIHNLKLSSVDLPQQLDITLAWRGEKKRKRELIDMTDADEEEDDESDDDLSSKKPKDREIQKHLAEETLVLTGKPVIGW